MKLANIDISTITDSAELPVTLSEAKSWLRVAHTEDDGKISELISTAVSTIEAYINTPVITKTLLYKTSVIFFDKCNCEFLYLPYPPTVINSVKIYNSDDVATILTTTSQFGRKILLGDHGVSARDNQAYEINFDSGISNNAANTPNAIKITVKEIVAKLYDECSDKSCGDILSSLDNYRSLDQIGLV